MRNVACPWMCVTSEGNHGTENPVSTCFCSFQVYPPRDLQTGQSLRIFWDCFFFLAQEWENKATWLISGKGKKKKRTRDVGPKLGHALHTQNSDYERRTIEMESDPHCAKQYRSGTWDRVQGFLWPQGLCFLLWHDQSLSAVQLNRSCGATH